MRDSIRVAMPWLVNHGWRHSGRTEEIIMRRECGAMLVVMLVTLVISGCARQVAGAARIDPHQPGTAISSDGYGVIAGDPHAPIQIEIFTEPQCAHCADLQADFGRALASYISMGQLAVTYRPVTFVDDTDYSPRVSNTLFLAAVPQTTGRAFQSYVEALWGHQDKGGNGPSDAELARMARESGVSPAAVDRIAAGATGVDTKAMSDLNIEFLSEISVLEVATPTVYDLVNDDVLDVYDANWLAKLMSKS
jgi:Thioredoxin